MAQNVKEIGDDMTPKFVSEESNNASSLASNWCAPPIDRGFWRYEIKIWNLISESGSLFWND